MDQIIRMQFRAYLNGEPSEEQRKACNQSLDAAVRQGEMLTACVYRWGENLFVYFEGINAGPNPHALLGPLAPALCAWPGAENKRLWVPMMDVFHFNEPQDLEHWLRKTEPESRVGKVGILRPEMAASYIYYHYGLQEERTFSGDKYEIIALHENLLFGYFEYPAVEEEPPYEKRLSTKSMPENWQDAKIPEHFIRWPDYQGCLLPLELWAGSWRK